MPRTPYPDPDAESAYQSIVSNSSKTTATKELADAMTVDNYTGGLVSSKAGSEAQSIDETVRKKR